MKHLAVAAIAIALVCPDEVALQRMIAGAAMVGHKADEAVEHGRSMEEAKAFITLQIGKGLRETGCALDETLIVRPGT